MRELYIDLLIRTIANTIYGDGSIIPGQQPAYVEARRLVGKDWPAVAHSMAGVARLKSLAELVTRVVSEDIPGHMIETGVWRGGCCILMKGILKSHQDVTRKVFLADSFEGLPKPSPELFPVDTGDILHRYDELRVSEAQVRNNFQRYDLLDDRVVFVKGFFSDTLEKLAPEPLSLIRLDGDMYESTIVALNALYPRLSPGGFVIIDDYGALKTCKQAVDDFRLQHSITAPMHVVDWTGVWWQKPVS
ncbi:MAG: TylF/MycF/NovP-related O-methyltransferase [Rhizobiaceae bacterium]